MTPFFHSENGFVMRVALPPVVREGARPKRTSMTTSTSSRKTADVATGFLVAACSRHRSCSVGRATSKMCRAASL